MTKGACSKKEKCFVCKSSEVPWRHVKGCKTVQRIPGMLLVWEGPDARPSGGAIVNLSIRNTEKEGGMGTKGEMVRQTEDKQKGWKEGAYDIRREKMERGAWKQTIGGRQVPGGYAGDWGVRRRRAREMDEADPCWVSVSDSRLGLLCAPVSRVGQTQEYSSSPSHILSYSSTFLLHFLYFILLINRLACNLHTFTHPCNPSASLPLSLSLARSLGAIFTSKPLHYLPSLRAIRNGVTLSGRHGHGIITTHPLSWGPLWGPPTLMERILGAPYPELNSTHPSTYPQPAPPFDW